MTGKEKTCQARQDLAILHGERGIGITELNLDFTEITIDLT